MFSNEDLFDHFRSARRRGYRSGWTAPKVRAAQVHSHYGMTTHGLPEPAAVIYESDVLDPEIALWAGTFECPYCGETGLDKVNYGVLQWDNEFACYACDSENQREWPDTVAAILREEAARR